MCVSRLNDEESFAISIGGCVHVMFNSSRGAETGIIDDEQ